MILTLKIITFIFLLNLSSSSFAAAEKIKSKSKDIIEKLTKKSLKKDELLSFIADNVIMINEVNGEESIVYYFENNYYKRYKDLKLISEDKWTITKLGHLRIFRGKEKSIWKIQIEKGNYINIKNENNLIGNLNEFSYEDKTNYYIKLEEKKFNDSKSN